MRFILTLIVTAACGLIGAQTRPPAPHEPAYGVYVGDTARRVIVTGRVINAPPEELGKLVYMVAGVAPLTSEQVPAKGTVGADGVFTVELTGGYPLREIWFGLGDLFYGTAFVRAGLTLTFDYAQLVTNPNNRYVHPGLTFGGPDAELAGYRARQVKTQLLSNEDFFQVVNERGPDPLTKLSMMDSVLAELRAVDATVLAAAPADVRTILEAETTTAYFAIGCVLFWQNGDPPAAWRTAYLAHRPPALSNRGRDFYKYYTKLEQAAVASQLAERFPRQDQSEAATLARTRQFLRYVDSRYAPGRADVLRLYLKEKDPLTHYGVLELAEATATVPWVRRTLRRQLERRRAEVDALRSALATTVVLGAPAGLGEPLGRTPFGAELYRVAAGTSGRELLDRLRGAFPAASLYTDLWATWCSPCIGELPFSAKLHEAAAGLPLRFVYLCTDQGGSEERWRRLIAADRVPGVHLYVPASTHAELMKLCLAEGYPTYRLLLPGGGMDVIERPSRLDRQQLADLLPR